MYLRGNTCSKQTTPSIYIQYIAVSSNTTILLSLYLLYLYIYNIFLCNNNILYVRFSYFHWYFRRHFTISPFHPFFCEFFFVWCVGGVWWGGRTSSKSICRSTNQVAPAGPAGLWTAPRFCVVQYQVFVAPSSSHHFLHSTALFFEIITQSTTLTLQLIE